MSGTGDKKINVVTSTASAPTELAAFDAALHRAGVGDMNLIHLSSVIPVGYNIITEHVDYNNAHQGDRLYVVYATQSTSQKGKTVAAGLGWIQTKDDPLWGLFVEHTGDSEEDVERQIMLSLNSMQKYRNAVRWGDIHSAVTSVTCDDKPVSALALAVFKRESW